MNKARSILKSNRAILGRFSGHLRFAVFLLTVLCILGVNSFVGHSASYRWCKGLSSIKGDEVFPQFDVFIPNSEDWLAPGTYKINMNKKATGTAEQTYGYVQIVLKSDRSYTVAQVNTTSLGGTGDQTVSFYHDGKLYRGNDIAGSVGGGGAISWSKLDVTTSECSLTSFKISPPYYPQIALTLTPESCPSPKSVAGNSAGSLHSIHYTLGVGFGTNALGRGYLTLDEEVNSTNIARPNALRFLATKDYTIIKTNNYLRQILSAQVLVDIVTNSDYQYEMRLYRAQDSGVTNGAGLYVPQITNMVKQVIVANPDTTTNYARLWITEIEGSVTNQYQYYSPTNSTGDSNTWELVYPGNLRKDVTLNVWDANRLAHTNTFQVFTPGSPDKLVYQEIGEYRDDGFGDVMVRQIMGTNGVSLTNTWEYYTNSAETYRYRKLKQSSRWDGFWESYDYDDKGRETNRLTAYLNATNGSAASLCRSLTTTYAGDASSTTGLVTRVEKLLGQEISRTYSLYYSASNSFRTVKCTAPGAALFDSGNLVTIVNRDKYSRPTNIVYPDFTKSFLSYVTNADKSVTSTVSHGQTNGPGTTILEGTKTITVVGPYGEMVSNIVINIAGGTDGIILERDSYTYAADDYARLYATVTHLDGTTTSGSSGCCGSPNTGNTVDKDGTTTYYVEDALKRRVSATVNNITSSNIFDAYGNSLVTLRVGTDLSVITNRTAVYDTAAQLLAETNAINSPTLYTNWIDGSGQLVKQTTYADGGTRVETYFRDGQLESVKGSAVFPVRYEYGVESDGGVQRAYSKEIKLDAVGSDTSEWTKSYADMLGRTYKTVYAAASGTPFAISYYNTKGQLTNQVDPDGVATLYAYNPKGELAYTVLDVDRDYTIDWSGDDRISYVTNDVVNNGTADVRRTRAYVWDTSADSSRLVSTTETSADGLRSWNTIWNNGTAITSQSRTLYDAANGYRYVTNTAPDNSYSVAITRYGTNVSQTAFDSTGAQLAQVTFGYDPHGRPCKFTDARTGTTTNYFNNADQVSGSASPIPAAGQSSQVTTMYYDDLGRVWKTTLPDSTSVTNEYFATGQLKKTYGSRTYPVEYTYDAQGRMKTMKTWQNFAANSGTATTTWNYDQYRGWLTNKIYDGGAAGPSYTYTAAGRLATRAWARGITTSYSYNNAGDLSTTYYSDSTAGVTNTFNRLGQTTGVTNGTTVCVMDYNDAGLVLTERYTAGILSGIGVTNVYDNLLRRTNVATLGVSTGYRYDNASRLAQVLSGTNTASYAYLANSPLVSQIAFTNGSALRMTTTKQYDLLNRLTSITNLPSAASALGFRYAYNNANQRTSVTNADTARWVYQYDSLGQVMSGKKYWSDGTPVAGQQFEYSLDDIGNRKTTASGGDQSGLNLRSASYTNNALNQITGRSVPGYVDVQGSATNTATVTVNNQATYRFGDYFRTELTAANSSPLWFGLTNVAVLNNGTNADTVASTTGFVFVAQSPEAFGYDADGNMTNDGRWLLTWDAENRLTKAESLASTPAASKRKVEWTYDYSGRRVRQTTSDGSTGSYVITEDLKFFADGWQHIAELNVTNNALVRSYVWGLDLSGSLDGAGGVGGLLMLNSAANATHFYAYDGNGNVTELIRAVDGTESARYDYESFGRVLRATGLMADENRFQFSTKRCDRTTDLQLYEFRVRRSDLTWLSRDPSGELTTRNLSGFVDNDGINFFDLEGLEKGAEALVRMTRNGPSAFPHLNPVNGLRILGGLPFSILSGDIFVSDRFDAVEPGRCSVLVTVNGINNNAEARRRINELAQGAPRYAGSQAMMGVNRTTYMGDLLQILGDELGAIQISSIRLANQINSIHDQFRRNGCCCAKIQVLAHSQGTMVFRRAWPLIRPEVRRLIYYVGIGGETSINGDYGLAGQENLANNIDPVPIIGNFNPLRWVTWPFVGLPDYDLIEGNPHNSYWEHSYDPFYDWAIQRLPTDGPCIHL